MLTTDYDRKRAIEVMTKALQDNGIPVTVLYEMIADRKNLRDEFAMVSPVTILHAVHNVKSRVGVDHDPEDGEVLDSLAELNYVFADAMLKARGM